MSSNYVILQATDFIRDKYSGFAVIINRNTNQHDEAYINCALLEDNGKYHMGDYAWFLLQDAKITTLNDVQKAHAESLYHRFLERHRTSPYRVIGRLYEEEPFFDDWDTWKRCPSYKQVEGSEKEWALDPKEAASLDEASEWLLKNHPDYWMGANIVQECPSGNFSAHAVPCAEYTRGYYETYAGRYRFAVKEAMRRGIKAGPSEILRKSCPGH